MTRRIYPRATEPHHTTLATALEPVLHNFALGFYKGDVQIDAEFTGVTDAQIQALVDAAPAASTALDVKTQVDAIPPLLEAIVWTLVDAINIERQQHGRPAITRAAFRTAVKAKIDEAP